MAALRAGAYHVTAVERWLYLSLACKEALEGNGFDDATYSVLYKRPTDLALLTDVRICCNLLVCEMFDEGEERRSALVRRHVFMTRRAHLPQVGITASVELASGECCAQQQ